MERVLKNMGIWLMQLIVATLLMTAGSQSVKAQTSSTTTTPVQPTAIFTPTGLEVTVGQLNFTRPTLSVTDPNTKKPIRGKFIERWYIKDKDGNIVTESKEVDNRVMYTDPTTGSTVSQLYGLDAIGDKAGTFTLVDELQPLPRYEKDYKKATATYTVTVKSPTVTAEYYNGSTLLNGTTANALQLYTYKIKAPWGNRYTTGTTSVPVPTAKLYYTLDNATYDVTSDFTFAYKVSDTKNFSIINNTIKTSLIGEGEGTLTITATPKDDNAKAKYGSTDIVTNIPINVGKRTEKIKTYIYFAKHEEDTYKYHNISSNQYFINSPDIIVKDEFGNDITNLVTTWSIKWANEAKNVFQKFSKDPHDSINEINATYGSLTSTNTYRLSIMTQTGSSKNIYGKIQFSRPDDYLVTVKEISLSNTNIYEKPVADPNISETVEGQFYNANGYAPYTKENTYTVGSNQMILRVHKRVPTIKLTPDPSTVQLAEGYTMNSFNRFNIGGVIRDPYDATDPVDSASNFKYRFFLPDNMKYGSDAAKKEPNNVTLEVTTNAPQTDCYEWVPAYHNGVLDKNEDGSQKMELVHGTYYESWKGYNDDDFKMLFHLPSGVEFAENVPIIYSIVPWNPNVIDVGISGYYSFKVTKKKPTHFVIDPKSQVTGTGGTVPCPSITVQDQFGEDITSYFTVSKKKAKDSEAYTLNPDGSVTSTTAGSYDVTVSGTLTDTESAASNGHFFGNPADDSYTAVFKQTSSGSVGAYEIIYDEDEFSPDAKTKATSKMGKLHFIKEGEFFPGTISYGEVPGINITFGNADDTDNPWTIKTSAEKSDIDNANDGTADNVSKEYIEGDAVIVDENTGLPKAGCYLKIEAVTNGWLTIDVKFLGHKDKGDNLTEPEQFILRDGTTLETQVHSETTDIIKEYTFPKPLLAGHTYYLYTDDGNINFHGISYAPGFIDPVTDARPWTTPGAVDLDSVRVSSTFMNGYTGTLPTLSMHRQNEHVSWYVLDVPSGSSSTSVDDIKEQTNNAAKHVYVGQNDGRIYAEALTTEAPLTDNSRKNTDAYGRVRVFAKVLGKKLSETQQVRKLPGYYLFVADMPTYIVQEGEGHSQDDRVSTTNIPTRIWMTFGGWHWSQAKEYPYYQNNDSTKKWLEDGWKTSKMDSVGRNNQTIDGFTFVTFGEQNPTDEFVRSWDKGEHNTFSLPVRGTYLKFEPEESGQLFVYLVQNGMTDNTKGDDAAKLKKNGPWLRRRAVYIVDETGHPVAIDDLSGWQAAGDWNRYVNNGTTNADRFPGYHNWHLNYYCDGVTRCAWKYDGTNELAISTADPATATAKGDKNAENEKKYSWFGAYDHDHDGKLTDKERKAMNDDADKIKTWWTTDNYLYPTTTVNGKDIGFTYTHTKLDGPLEVLQLSDTSYVLPTKGYVRYTFHVQAGKVYYVFATGSKLGFCGFGFLPAGYRSNPTTWINAGQPNEFGEFDESVYDKLPKPSNDIYKAGGTGQNRLMGGTVTLDVKKKANEDGSYGTFKKGGFVLRGETTATMTSDNTMSDNTTATKRDFVNVTLQRSFRNQRWAGLCLPFTVSETQMKRIFGDDMQLITVDSVMASKDHERTLHFTQHVNQLCEAGRPYFVYPNKSGIDAGQSIGESVTFNGVTFEGIDAATVVMTNESVVAHNAKAENANNKINIFTYKVTGIYDKSIIPWMSYYMRNTEDETTNKLYRIVPAGSTTSKGTYLPGCNVYLFPYSADPEGKELVVTDDGTVNPAKLASFWITGAEVSGGSTTGIDELVSELNEQSTAFHRGVYDLQGHCVSSDNSLKGLRPGIYLMGGKKYVVK